MEASGIATTETRVVQSLPPSVQHALAQMDVQSQNAFFFEYQAKQKSVMVARLLSFLLGWHYIYLRKTGMQFLYWASWFFICPGFIWWIVDLVRMKTKVEAANELVAREILQNLAIGNQFKTSVPRVWIPSGATPCAAGAACPSCGGTRAGLFLLSGDPLAAVKANAGVTVFLLVIAGLTAGGVIRPAELLGVAKPND